VLPTHKTRIVATIGPASDVPDVLEAMIRAGLDVARLNFSHGKFEEHAARIDRLRAAAAAAGREIALLADLPGPKMRIGELEAEPIELVKGQPFTLTTDEIVGNVTRASVSFARLPQAVKPNDRLLLNDGLVEILVQEVSGPEVRCEVQVGGELRSRKGLNLPGIDLGISAFTDRDRECLAFALEHGVDIVSQSFVESRADIRAVREAARELGHEPFVIAKIERAGALDRIDEILDEADGIMVARGDLGVEVPVERIAVLQKDLVRRAVVRGRPVITATQMLESMTHSRQPTRAEATDVANAILDGTDAVMLSGESAIGDYPVEAVATLARIAAATEPHRPRFDLWDKLRSLSPDANLDVPDLLSLGIEAVMGASKAAAVVVPTRTGTTARRISRFRLPVWIAAPSPDLQVCRRLLLSYGVEPIHLADRQADWSAFARDWMRKQGVAGHLAILVTGPSEEDPGANSRMELLELDAS
jgi:pyruvate kinase